MEEKMDLSDRDISIEIDYRENPSGIPHMLMDLGAKVIIKTLDKGDYIINEQFIIERKTKNDFVLSLMQKRLFGQCAKLRKTHYHVLMLIEGNPYANNHNISREAVKGALLSVSCSWQIPIIYSSDTKDSAQTLMMLALQNLKEHLVIYRTAIKPKTLKKQQIYFLCGLPMVGAKTAQKLLEHFGSLDKILMASQIELKQVKGIGKDKARKIREFLHS